MDLGENSKVFTMVCYIHIYSSSNIILTIGNSILSEIE